MPRNNVLVTIETCTFGLLIDYAAFFCPDFNRAHRAVNRAHRARWNAAIFLRAAADIVRFAGAGAVAFAVPTSAGCDSFRALAHLAFCACSH
jgi:hypothetical protein